MQALQNINILDPNLAQTHPTLVPWVNGMQSAGYSPAQIQMYFKQQMQAQMNPSTMVPPVYLMPQQPPNQSHHQIDQESATRMFDNENPLDIVLVLLRQYPQIETWLQTMEYHDTVTNSRTHAVQFLTSLMDSQPQFTQFIKLITQQLKQRRAQGDDPSEAAHNLINSGVKPQQQNNVNIPVNHQSEISWEEIDIIKALLWNSDGKSMQWIASELKRSEDDVRKKIKE
eukprot:429406_1